MRRPRLIRKMRLWDVFLLPGTAWLVLLFVVPMAIVIAVSLGSLDIINRPVFGFHPENYSNVFQGIYIKLMVRSLAYAGLTTLICFVVGYPVAYTIARFGGRYRNLLICIVVLPWLVDYLVRIYAWVVILGNNGLVNSFLHTIGVQGSPAVQLTNTGFAVIAGLVYSYFPLMVLPLYAVLESLPSSLIEAAKDLYATPRRAFVGVTLPLSLPGIVSGCLLVFLPCVGDFATAKLLGGPSQYMLGNLLSDQFTQSGNLTFGAALTVVVMAFMWLIIIGFLVYSARSGKRGLDAAI
jgi:spermidine/putrescine transport system permease protein